MKAFYMYLLQEWDWMFAGSFDWPLHCTPELDLQIPLVKIIQSISIKQFNTTSMYLKVSLKIRYNMWPTFSKDGLAIYFKTHT